MVRRPLPPGVSPRAPTDPAPDPYGGSYHTPVPEHVKDVDTGVVSVALHEAAEHHPITPERFLDALAVKLAKSVPGGGGPPTVSRRRGNWNTLIAAVLAVVGSVSAGWFALKSRVAEHDDAIKSHTEAPMHDGAREAVSEIKSDITEIRSSQTQISEGIDELKQERIKGLKQELEEAKRALRTRRRQ